MVVVVVVVVGWRWGFGGRTTKQPVAEMGVVVEVEA